MRYEHVFRDLRPFPQCHAPSIVRLRNAAILAVWFGGRHEKHGDTAIYGARRDANGWSEPRRLAKVDARPHWNPVVFALDANGPVSASESAGHPKQTIVLHFKVGSSIRSWTTWACVSRDGGKSFDAPRELVAGDRGGRGCVKNKPIRLTDGSWLAGASLESTRSWEAFVDRSPNGLSEWEAMPRIPLDRRAIRGKGVIQPALWTSSRADVHALLRSTEGVLMRSDSSDAGRNWSTARRTEVPHNNSGIDVIRTRSGLVALACNPVAGNWAARTPLTVLFSRNNGESWPHRIDLETDPGEYSYPAIIEDDDGLLVAYTWNRRRIAVVRLDSHELPAADSHPD